MNYEKWRSYNIYTKIVFDEFLHGHQHYIVLAMHALLGGAGEGAKDASKSKSKRKATQGRDMHT